MGTNVKQCVLEEDLKDKEDKIIDRKTTERFDERRVESDCHCIEQGRREKTSSFDLFKIRRR